MKRKSNTGRIVAGIVLAVLIIAGASYFTYAFFQVENVKASGNGKYTEIYIANLADVPEKTHMFLLDEDKIKENVEKEPYLEVLAVKKQYPNTVVVEVKERQPRTLISYSGQLLLTDIDGNVLEIRDNAEESGGYPVIDGIAISAVTLGRPVSTDDTFKLTVMGELLNALENRDLTKTIQTMDLSDINNIKLKTAEGLTIKFGQADSISEKVRWIYKMLPTLKKDGRTKGVLDVSSGSFPVYKLDESEMEVTAPPEESAEPTEEPTPTEEPEQTPEPEE